VTRKAAQPTTQPDGRRRDLTGYAWLAIGAAVTTITLKTGAWLLTGSVGLLSDAAESVVNLVAAVVALIALRVAALPADDNHQFGHAKAEYFSAAVEGFMIFVAAVVIIVSAVQRFLSPRELENVGLGLVVSVVASVINGAVALVLIRAGRAHRSITLTADGRHLMTDVWTSAGVVVGVVGVVLTGWLRLDPLVAMAVGVNIIVTGAKLLSESVAGLMDGVLDAPDVAAVEQVLATFGSDEVQFHQIRTRMAGHQRFLSVHVLVPGAWSVQRGHDLLEDVEAALCAALQHLSVETHLEPIEDPRAYEAASPRPEA
jgi:cation diffusion facilitator family transporter